MVHPSLVPRPPRPAFVACSTKSRGRPGWTYHVTSRTVATYVATIDLVAIGLAGQTEQKERTEFRERRVKGREQTQTWHDVSRGTHHVISPSRPSFAFHTANLETRLVHPATNACPYSITQAWKDSTDQLIMSNKHAWNNTRKVESQETWQHDKQKTLWMLKCMGYFSTRDVEEFLLYSTYLSMDGGD